MFPGCNYLILPEMLKNKMVMNLHGTTINTHHLLNESKSRPRPTHLGLINHNCPQKTCPVKLKMSFPK